MRTHAAIWAISRKEIFHIVRDPFTLAMALGMPVVVVLFFGFAIEFNLDRIPVAVYDGNQTTNSRRLIRSFTGSDYFIPKYVPGPTQALQALDAGSVHAALIIPPDYSEQLANFKQSSVQILVDGTDNASAGSILGYLGGVQRAAIKNEFSGNLGNGPVTLETRFLYNPELNSRWFVVPGLAAVVIAVLSILMTALTVAREWENGSMELLLGTPVTPLEIILGKLAPYCVMGLVAVIFVFAMAEVVFQVPFRGNFILYLLACLVFIATYSAQGLLISVVARKQQLSMQIAMLTGFLPTILLSGFIFPCEHMPDVFNYLTMLLPARWFMAVSRSLFLQGAGVGELYSSLLIMMVLLLVMILLATKKFKKDVEP